VRWTPIPIDWCSSILTFEPNASHSAIVKCTGHLPPSWLYQQIKRTLFPYLEHEHRNTLSRAKARLILGPFKSLTGRLKRQPPTKKLSSRYCFWERLGAYIRLVKLPFPRQLTALRSYRMLLTIGDPSDSVSNIPLHRGRRPWLSW
jgi:hypothetical protein